MPLMNMIQALNQALYGEMERNPDLVVFGEDCGHFGGVFRVTKGLQEAFGEERCFDSPLNEAGIVGFAIGLAQMGLKPVVEIQFADYIYPSFDQIVNELAKMRYRTGNRYSAPMVIRAPYGGGIHGGLYHSQSPEAFFCHVPGLRVVIPSSPYEAKGLLTAAIRANDPVLFLEPKRYYRALKEEVPLEPYEIPLGKAHLARRGREVTLVGWGAQHRQNLEAAELLSQEGVEVEVICLTSLNPLDLQTIELSVQKSGRCLIAHEAPLTQGFGAELAAQIQERCFYHLESPVTRCCGWDTPFPHTLEKEYLPDSFRVADALRGML